MKSLLGKFGTLALVGMAGVAITACSSSLDNKAPGEKSAQHNENTGNVSLALQPVLGLTVANVTYTVTAGDPSAVPTPAIVVGPGNLPTPGTSDNFSFGIPLPVGTGYYISLTGVATENASITCTGVQGPFAVQPNATTAFNMTLTCVDTTNGQIVATVDVETDACPKLVVDYAVAEPSTANVGSAIKVYSAAHDTSNAAEVITYAWAIKNPAQAAVGSFAPANIDDTTFNCTGPGNTVTIKVTATNHECSKSLETIVSCTSVTCGDGVVDPLIGETCDYGAGPGHPADPGCPLDCTKVCGDGNAEGSETCNPTPADPANCLPQGDPAECTVRAPSCGDGFVTGSLPTGEICDTNGNIGVGGAPLPLGNTCASDCKSIQMPTCGDGVAAGAEECDDGTGTASTPVQAISRECSAGCQRVATTACVSCEQGGNCFASSDNCKGPAATPFTTAQQNTCMDVVQCIQDSNCLDGSGSLGACYCGTLPQADCQSAPFNLAAAGAPNGPCAALMQAGSPTLTSNVQILGGLTNKSRPGGAAGQRLNCQKNDPNCAPLCGVQ